MQVTLTDDRLDWHCDVCGAAGLILVRNTDGSWAALCADHQLDDVDGIDVRHASSLRLLLTVLAARVEQRARERGR